MDSIATTGSRIGPAFPRFGQRTGLAGNLFFFLLQDYVVLVFFLNVCNFD
jgi:hypothetical protein